MFSRGPVSSCRSHSETAPQDWSICEVFSRPLPLQAPSLSRFVTSGSSGVLRWREVPCGGPTASISPPMRCMTLSDEPVLGLSMGR